MDLLILESTVIHNCHNTPRHVFEKPGCNAVITEQVETVGYHAFFVGLSLYLGFFASFGVGSY